MFKELGDRRENNIKCFDLYGSYLVNIVNNTEEGKNILDKNENIKKIVLQGNKQLIDKELTKYSENTNSTFFIVSGNYNNLG